MQKHHHHTEQRILEAAHAVFLRRGTAGARMQEIATEAGVNQALLHYYFRSKERLAKAAFAKAASQLMPPVIEVLASDASLEDKVRRVVALELDHLSKFPYLSGFVISELTYHPERASEMIAVATGRSPRDVWPRVISMLGKQLQAEIRKGTIRPITPDQFIVNLMSLCIFPFATRPMVMAILELDQAGFGKFIERRRKELPAFFLAAVQK